MPTVTLTRAQMDREQRRLNIERMIRGGSQIKWRNSAEKAYKARRVCMPRPRSTIKHGGPPRYIPLPADRRPAPAPQTWPPRPLCVRIREQREACHFSLTVLAEEAKISKPMLSLVESGIHKMSCTFLSRLEAALGFRPGELVNQRQYERTDPAVRALIPEAAARAFLFAPPIEVPE